MVMMWRVSRRLISFTSAAIVVVFPDPVGPPIRTSPRGSRLSASTLRRQAEAGQTGHRRRQPADRRRGAAALVMQVDAEAAEIAASGTRRRQCRFRGTLAARAAAAPARRHRRFPRRRAALRRWRQRPPPSTRSIGGAPATSSRSLADWATTCSSQARSRAVCPSVLARGTPALSSVTSASRSSGSFIAGHGFRCPAGPEPVQPASSCRTRRSRDRPDSSSGSFRNRVSGATWRKTSSTRRRTRARGEAGRELRGRRETAGTSGTPPPRGRWRNRAARAAASRLRARPTRRRKPGDSTMARRSAGVGGDVLAHRLQLRRAAARTCRRRPRPTPARPGSTARRPRCFAQAAARKDRRDVGLERRLVLRESRVAIDAVQRGLRAGDELRRERAEVDRQPLDDRDQRRAQQGLVPLLARLEPFAIVVALQRPQERDRGGGEPQSGARHRDGGSLLRLGCRPLLHSFLHHARQVRHDADHPLQHHQLPAVGSLIW